MSKWVWDMIECGIVHSAKCCSVKPPVSTPRRTEFPGSFLTPVNTCAGPYAGKLDRIGSATY